MQTLHFVLLLKGYFMHQALIELGILALSPVNISQIFQTVRYVYDQTEKDS